MTVEQAIRDEIMRRTGGRIQLLEVEVRGERIVVRGRASCYHLKQLAIQAVLEVVDFACPISVELEVPSADRLHSVPPFQRRHHTRHTHESPRLLEALHDGRGRHG
jgi:hypothetical protein